MSKSNSFETSFLQHVLQNADIAAIGDATGLRGSSTAGSLYISLHTGDPGEAGDQTTNECDYTSYTRIAVARSGAGWTVSGNNGTNAADTTFPECTGGTNTATHFGIGTASTGAGVLLFSEALTASLAISTGITPYFPAGDLDINED